MGVDMYKHQIVKAQLDISNQHSTEVRKALLIALEDGRKVVVLDLRIPSTLHVVLKKADMKAGP